MRLRHPKILEIVVSRDDLPATIISHVWSEIFKWYGSGKPKHPKMFIVGDYNMGIYLQVVYGYSKLKTNCCLDKNKINTLPEQTKAAFLHYTTRRLAFVTSHIMVCFNNNDLFSDLESLYFKGHNLYPNVFGSDWKRYCPVISHNEIKRQVDKTLANSSRLRK